MDSESYRALFASNFNALLDKIKAPESGYGRTRFVSEKYGIGMSSAGRWLTGTTTPDPWRLDEIATSLNASIDELIGPARRKRRPRMIPDPCQICHSKDSELAHPVCHALLSSMNVKSRASRIDMVPPVPPDYPRNDTLYLHKIASKSMEPFVMPGDFVAFLPVSQFEGDGEYVLWQGDRFSLRRLVKEVRNNKLQVITESKRYPDEEVDAESLIPVTPGAITSNSTSIQGVVLARILVNR